MSVDVKVPALGESISEVQIGEWLKQSGDWVDQDESLVELESDKATVELPAPAAGKLAKIVKQSGDFADIGELVAVIDDAASPDAQGGGGDGDGAGKKKAGKKKGKQEPPAEPEDERETAPQSSSPAEPEADAPEGGHVMPAARRLATEEGVDLAAVAGSGPGGRILKEDVQRNLERASAESEDAEPESADETAAPSPRSAASGPRRDAPESAPPAAGERRERAVPMSPIRRRIAERLVGAQQTAALLTTFNEIDMSAVVALRKRQQEAFRERHGLKLGFMSFFTRATIEALKLYPELNAEIRDQDILYKDYHDIGIAIGSGKGLVVPIIRDADSLSFAQIEERIADFAERAQKKKLDLSELEGGTFTISNGGVYGSLLSTPIVNPPQSGVLGLHTIQDRPVVIDGEIQVRKMMYVALTYDHRIVDGREAVTFLRHIKQSIEEPERLLLQI